MTARVEAERAIAAKLAGHAIQVGIRDGRVHCVCGWASRSTVTLASDRREEIHRVHLASVLADLMVERQAEAIEGYPPVPTGYTQIAPHGHPEGWNCNCVNIYRPDPKDTRDE